MTTPNYPVGAPNWIDIGTTDIKGAVDFYTSLFGWTYEDLSSDAGEYGEFRLNGKRAAGIGSATDPERGTSWTTYLATDDTDDTATKVEKAGGKVVLAPMQVTDQGKLAVFMDTTGAFISVWEPGAHRGAEVTNEHGSLTWNELMTSDMNASKAFYQNVFGVSTRDNPIPNDGGTYTLIEVDGKPVAGAMETRPEWGPMPSHWSVYFAIDDCDAMADKAVQLGATEMTRQDSPAGRFATLQDPQGGSFSVIKNDPDFSM